jgi:ATP-dependent Clp protease ATP-binding subunit ClpC
VEGAVPAILYDKKILACDISRLVAEGGGDRARYTGVIRSLSEAGNVIAFIEGIDGSLGSALSYGSLGGPSPLASLVSATGLNCIIATASHRGLIEKDKTLAAHVQEIRLVPLTEMECRTMLTAMIGELETFHGMSFEEDAITAAIIHGKEIQAAESVVVWVADLLDRTAAHVRIQREKVPPNLRDVQRRIRIAARRMEDALANHDLAKARLCSDEERELRGTLRQLLGKYQFDEKVIVTERDIAAVVDLWGGASLE